MAHYVPPTTQTFTFPYDDNLLFDKYDEDGPTFVAPNYKVSDLTPGIFSSYRLDPPPKDLRHDNVDDSDESDSEDDESSSDSDSEPESPKLSFTPSNSADGLKWSNYEEPKESTIVDESQATFIPIITLCPAPSPEPYHTPLPPQPVLNQEVSTQPPSRPQRGRKRRQPLYNSEDEDEFASNATDDEYRPSPPPPSASKTRKSVRASPPYRVPARARHSIRGKRRASPTPSSSSSRPVTSTGKRLRVAPGPRNEQASVPLALQRPKIITTANGGEAFVCPVCKRMLPTSRSPDYNRHMLTHFRPDGRNQSEGWWCKGVPLEDAHLYDLPADARVYDFLGKKRTGGCLQTFSRRDALKRHLDNRKIVCVGKACKPIEE